jgi:hypothetical protein
MRRSDMDSEERLLAYWAADRQQSSAQWTKGGLLLDLEDESLVEFSKQVNDSYQQLANYKWVASRYPVPVRTETLSWTHHERIAGRDDRLDWLKKAADNYWSVRTMLEEIKAFNRAKGGRKEVIAQAAMAVVEIGARVDRFVEVADEVEIREGTAGLMRFLEKSKVSPEMLAVYRNGEIG